MIGEVIEEKIGYQKLKSSERKSKSKYYKYYRRRASGGDEIHYVSEIVMDFINTFES